MFFSIAALCLIAYLIGALPFGKWIAAAYGVDILSKGSGNIGATNVWRTLGPKAGLPVFLLDALKGFLPSLVGGIVGGENRFSPEYALLVGTFSVIGHSASIFLRFRGGKSVATALGVVTAASPVVAGIAFGLFLLLFAITRYVSLSSLIAVASVPVLSAVFGYSPVVIAVYVGLAIIIIMRHKANIRRLLRGEEYRFGAKREHTEESAG